MRRRLAHLIAAVLVLAAQPALSGADPPSGGSVQIVPAGGGAPRDVSLADPALAPDVHDARYAVRAADGTTRTVTVASGVSLEALLSVEGVDPASFTYVDVPRADGTSVLVVHDEVFGPGVDGPPVIWADGGGVHFLRPSTGAQDVNADDLVTLPAGGAISLELRTGTPLGVRIVALRVRARVHQPIRFTAELLGGASAAGIGFSWYFGDGGRPRGAQVTHRFARPGTYLVQVNVVQGGRQLDTYDLQDVRIAAAPAQRKATAKQPGSGGARTGGGTGGAGSGTGGGAGGTGAAANGGGAGAPAEPTTVTPANPTPAARPRAHPRTAAPHFRPPPAPQGTLVSGTLLASASAAPLAAGGAGRHAAPAQDGGGGSPDGPLHIPAAAWVAVGLLAAVALGWALDARHTAPFWQP
jgi:PKD domain